MIGHKRLMGVDEAVDRALFFERYAIDEKRPRVIPKRRPSIHEMIATAPSIMIVEKMLAHLKEAGLGDNRARRKWTVAAAARITQLRKQEPDATSAE